MRIHELALDAQQDGSNGGSFVARRNTDADGAPLLLGNEGFNRQIRGEAKRANVSHVLPPRR